MSSVLKALKKLENDNATRWPGEHKIDAEIVRTDNHPRLSPAVLLVTSLLLLAGGSGVTFLYMKKDTALESSHPKPLSAPKQNPSQISASEIKTEQLPEAQVVIPAIQQKSEKVAAPKKQQQPVPIVKSPPHIPAKSVAVSRPAVVSPLHTTRTSPPHSLPASTNAVPALRVNGIAFQGANSVAMINGEPFSSGAIINGAKIEEIQKDKVKFSYNGEIIEIPLGQSNR